MDSNDPSNEYARALTTADPARVSPLLSNDARMDTPFSSWRAAADIQAAFFARSRVFRELVLRNVVKDANHSAVRWSAKVNEVPVEGVDLLSLGPDGFRLIEVFLRPARDLELVYSEMVAAWPRTE